MLFDPIRLRGVEFANRVWVSPMCQYSAVDGFATRWHDVHLGGYCTGGAGLVMTEATAVVPEGRISPQDLGIWSDAHAERIAPIVEFAHAQGTRLGIQLAHAGRKASVSPPWTGGGSVAPAAGGWVTVGPSPIPFGKLPQPRELAEPELAATVEAFAAAAVRADAIGADVVEVHGAHGYLLHEFLSPLSNLRTDAYGGDRAGRMRLALEVVRAVRAVWPEDKPLLFRLSATDWVEGGWDVEDSVALARELKELGVDLVDCSSGGNGGAAKVPTAPGYQVPFAAAVRSGAGIATGAVGLITQPRQAEEIISSGQADVVLLGRALLREPRWPLLAAAELGGTLRWPDQYLRARP